MSEPMRFSLKHHGQLSCVEHCPEGEYVFYLDYARLKAEVERIEPELEQRCRELNLSIAQQAIQLRQIGELKAEVERLRLSAFDKKVAIEAGCYARVRLKAEVERLNTGIQPEGCNDAVGRAVELLLEKEKEIARLKAEVESLKKPAIIGGYNISEYIRMANSETLEFDNGDIFADLTLPERIKYIIESHARLKAENEELQNRCDFLEGRGKE